jgi:hypothetical protein
MLRPIYLRHRQRKFNQDSNWLYRYKGTDLWDLPRTSSSIINPSPSSSGFFREFRLRHIASFWFRIVLNKVSFPPNIKTTSLSLTKWLKYSARCTLSEKRRVNEIRKTLNHLSFAHDRARKSASCHRLNIRPSVFLNPSLQAVGTGFQRWSLLCWKTLVVSCKVGDTSLWRLFG